MTQLALVAFSILAYTLIAVRLDRLSISGPIVLVTVGALLGPSGVGAVTAPATSEPFRVLAELTLALLLFSDASTIGLREAGGIAWLPGRLLAFGLPLTIAAGALVGWLLFPALGLGFALLLDRSWRRRTRRSAFPCCSTERSPSGSAAPSTSKAG